VSLIKLLIALEFTLSVPRAWAAPAPKWPPAPSGLQTAISPNEIFSRSISDSSGDIFLLPKAFHFLLSEEEFQTERLLPSHMAARPGGQPATIVPPHPMITHSATWDYDLRIPLAFYDPRQQWFSQGTYNATAVQQDVAPTLADVLRIAAPDRSVGRILSEARRPASAVLPKIVAVLVQDQMGWQYFAAHPNRAPYIRSILAKSALFVNAQVAHVDVETAVGHAAIGTGAYARGHGVNGNAAWNTGLWVAKPVFSADLPDQKSTDSYPLLYNAATLADVWVASNQNKPNVLSMVAAQRASISLGGHGSMFRQGKKTDVMFFQEHGDKALQYVTNESFYHLPDSVRGKSVLPYATAFQAEKGGRWFGHELVTASGDPVLRFIRTSPAQVRFESDLVTSAIAELKLGQGSETDLLFLNFKSSDYCGHTFGYESEECGEVLDAVDSAVKRLVETLQVATNGQFVLAYTADHGAAPLPELSGGKRYNSTKLLADLNKKFSVPGGRLDAFPFMSNSQIWANKPELARAGHTIAEVVSYLQNYQVPMAAPWNMLAADWLKKGKPLTDKFFYQVVSRTTIERGQSLQRSP